MSTNNAINAPSGGTLIGTNRIINGDFQVWQRGAGGSYSETFTDGIEAGLPQYAADRWAFTHNDDDVEGVVPITISQLPVNLSAEGIPNKFACNVSVVPGTVATGSFILFFTSLTDQMCIGCSGQHITISFKLNLGSTFSGGGGTLNIQLFSGSTMGTHLGQNGSYDDSVTLIAEDVSAPSTGLTYFTFTSANPTNANINQLCLQFKYQPTGTAGLNDSFTLSDVTLEAGLSPTPFQRKTFQQSLAECRYFYQKSFPYNIKPATQTSVNSAFCYNAPLDSTNIQTSETFTYYGSMRNTYWAGQDIDYYPLFKFFNPVNDNGQFYNSVANEDCSASTFNTQSYDNFTVSCLGSDGTHHGHRLIFHWTADGELYT